MTTPAFIVDTNVLFSGLSSGRANSPTARILDAMLNAGIVYLLSTELLQEYRDVLLRPRLARFHRLHENEIDMLLTEIAANGVWREPASLGKAPEPGDNHIWDLLLMDENAVLITGDRLLLNHPPARRSVITPADYITAFAH